MIRTLTRWTVDHGLLIADQLGILHKLHANPWPVVLMYHGIVPRGTSAVGTPAVDREEFARQMKYLKKHFYIIHPDDLEGRFTFLSGNGKASVALTFDDGLGSTAKISWPILEEMRIPAIFFVSTRHLQQGKYLWFMHARALFWLFPERRLRLLGRTWELPATTEAREKVFASYLEGTRCVSVQDLYRDLAAYPLEQFVPPEIIEDEIRGMTVAELARIAQSEIVAVGNHTRNHPYLTTCTAKQLAEEICGARIELERICGRPVTKFAYPAGDYNSAVAWQVRGSGCTLACAVIPHAPVADRRMAVPRAGIYGTGQGVLAGKSYGLISR